MTDNPVILLGTLWFDWYITNLRDPKVYIRLVHCYASSNRWRSAMYRVVECAWQYFPFDMRRSSKHAQVETVSASGDVVEMHIG